MAVARLGCPRSRRSSRGRRPPTPIGGPMLLLHFATVALVTAALLEVARMVAED